MVGDLSVGYLALQSSLVVEVPTQLPCGFLEPNKGDCLYCDCFFELTLGVGQTLPLGKGG